MTERTQPGAYAPALRAASFTGRLEGARLLADHVLPLLPLAAERRVLDLGCGIGDVAALIHGARPSARVAGIDFAPANVATAQARTDAEGVAFACSDYLTWQSGDFDLIVADSVLHLIDAPAARIAHKLAADLTPEGLVVATVPDASAVNQIHLLLRQFWRSTPKIADRLALTLAVRLYPNLSRPALEDRLPYLRLLPRLFGASELNAFAAAGLMLERSDPWPSSSLAKPRHRLMIWRRAA